MCELMFFFFAGHFDVEFGMHGDARTSRVCTDHIAGRDVSLIWITT